VHDNVEVTAVRAEIEELMRDRRRIAPSEDDDFTVMDMKEISAMLAGTTRTMTVLFSAVAAISLLVGGIGVMNIMLVSVTERTREIGIRIAIGALKRDVLAQFLVEAVVLSCFGGLLGIALAIVASLALTHLLHLEFVLDTQIIIIAFLFSAAVGIAFGYLPARKAANLNPIDALRHE
jgi:putative ABC transport system permease protein